MKKDTNDICPVLLTGLLPGKWRRNSDAMHSRLLRIQRHCRDTAAPLGDTSRYHLPRGTAGNHDGQYPRGSL